MRIYNEEEYLWAATKVLLITAMPLLWIRSTRFQRFSRRKSTPLQRIASSSVRTRTHDRTVSLESFVFHSNGFQNPVGFLLIKKVTIATVRTKGRMPRSSKNDAAAEPLLADQLLYGGRPSALRYVRTPPSAVVSDDRTKIVYMHFVCVLLIGCWKLLMLL